MRGGAYLIIFSIEWALIRGLTVSFNYLSLKGMGFHTTLDHYHSEVRLV